MKTISLMQLHAVVRRRSRARGVSLITAIFLLVVLAGLGAAMVSVSTAQHASAAMDVQGSRAYQAARAGIEWGLYKQLRTQAAGAPCFAASSSFTLPAGTTLSGFSVTVKCTSNTSIAALVRYRIVAIACYQPSGTTCPNYSNNLDYVQRRIQVEF